MSLGYGAWANLFLQDDESVIYNYGSYDLNEQKFENKNRITDGNIFIFKSCFVEPEIHEKLKRMPNGKKKLIVKRIPRNVDISQLISEEKIVIENCSNCWDCTPAKIDRMALNLLYKLFRQYQEEETIPEYISYNV